VRPAGRPDAVRRFLRRPLWWALLALVALGWIYLDDMVTSRRVDRALDAGPSAVALVEEVVADGRAVLVTFHHPVTGTPIRTVAELWTVDPPDPGTEVAIDIDPADPTRVAVAGDRRRPTAALGFELGLALVPVAFFAGRAMGVRRTERLMAAGGPSFSMLGALRSSGRVRPHVVLDLFPLDASASESPLCSLPLLHTGAVPLGRSHTVEVKGTPRPLGRLVARVEDGTILWPRGRASWRTWHSGDAPTLPKPGVIPAAVPVERLDRPKWTNIWRSLPPVLATLLAGGVAFGLMVTAITVANRAVAARADRSGTVVLGTVVERDPGFASITVRYRPDQAADDVDAVLVVDDDELHPDGSTVAIRVDPDDPAHVRLASEPYDAVVPLVWGWLPAFGAVLAGLAWLSVTHRNRRVDRSGWRRVASWRVPGTPLIALGFPAAATASCVARVAESTAERWPAGPTRWREVHVAGSMAPGDPVALRLGHDGFAAAWVAEAPPSTAPVERPELPSPP
jgi:hypothetical protein